MATQAQIDALRLNINQPDNVAPYTDELLGSLIDLYGGIDEAGKQIWIAKRNQAAKLVDISEGGSSRKNSQVFDNYDSIVKGYDDDEGVSTGRSTTRRIERA